jgi:hypothetical protein
MLESLNVGRRITLKLILGEQVPIADTFVNEMKG